MAFTAMIKGHGKVSTSPAGNRFARGQSITLKAIPDAEESFLGWGGDFDGTQSSIVLVMDRSKIVTANFTARPGLAVRSCDGSGNTPEFMFVLHGDLNQAYRIEVSSDLAVWAPSVVVTNYLGTVQVSDPWMAAPARRFYRAGVEP